MTIHEDPFWLSPPVFDADAWGLAGDDVVAPGERGRLYDAFYNRNHDQRGRFARNDEAAAPAEPDVSYRGLHQPDPDGPPANNLLDQSGEWGMPDDVYDHPEFYTGDPRSTWARETIRVLRAYRGKPDDTPITVYRASPGPINPGDWITLSRAYAEQHAMSNSDPAEDLPVQEATVPVGSVRFAGDDLSEFGYFPHKVSKAAATIARVEFANPNHDQRGRFARKGEGRSVPSGAVPVPPVERSSTARVLTKPEAGDVGTVVAWPDDSIAELTEKTGKTETWRYTNADGITAGFTIHPEAGWDSKDPQVKMILDEAITLTGHIGMEPVGVTFGDPRLVGTGALAGVESKKPDTILTSERSTWNTFEFALQAGQNLMPAATTRLVEGGVSMERYTIAHELGHVRDARSGRDQNHRAVTEALLRVGVPRPTDRAGFIAKMKDIGFSDYATMNVAETIAETHAQLLVDGSESLTPGPAAVAEAMGWLQRPGRSALTVTSEPQHGTYTVVMQRQNDPEDGLIVDTFVAGEPDIDGWAQLWDEVVNDQVGGDR